MFSDPMIGFYAAVGFGGWVYAKLSRSTGGNTTNAVIGAVGAGLVMFLLVLIVMGFVPNPEQV